MKSVLISINPKWVEKIVKGEKTIEVRKSKPKLETPFKCYIYCTYGQKNENYMLCKRGKVIGDFVCDSIICSQAYFDSQGKNHLTNIFEEDIKRTCLTEYELWNYIAGKAVKANEMYDGYLWHISDLKIYDKPKPIMQFYKPCPIEWKNCPGCELYSTYTGCCMNNINRPPQSWCYVEEI